MSVVYTCIFGDYDNLKEPRVKTPGWSYLCFTNQSFESTTWQIRRVDSKDEWLSSKMFKLLFYHQGKSIYIDGSFIINCNLDEFYNRHHAEGKISIMKHPARDCVYDEIAECIKLVKDEPERLRKAARALTLHRVGFHEGLPATGIILRDGSQKYYCEYWYNQIGLCRRDQISWALVNKKYPESCNLFQYDYTKGMDFLHVPHNHNKARRLARLKALKAKKLIA